MYRVKPLPHSGGYSQVPPIVPLYCVNGPGITIVSTGLGPPLCELALDFLGVNELWISIVFTSFGSPFFEPDFIPIVCISMG